MSILIWIIVGALAGWIASVIMRTDQQMGALGNIIVGMIGSIIGGTVFTFLTNGDFNFTNGFTGLNLSSILLSILGAVILLALVRMFSGTRSTMANP